MIATPEGDAALPGHHAPKDFPAPVRALAALSRALAVTEGVGTGLCLLALIALAVFQFMARNLRLHGQLWMPAPPDWTDGVIRHAVFVLGFLGAAYATYSNRHFRIDALTRIMRPRLQLGVRVVATACALVVCTVVVRAGFAFWRVCQQEAGEAAQQSELFSSARGAVVIIAGVALVGFHLFVQLVLDAVYLVTGRLPPTAVLAEARHESAP